MLPLLSYVAWLGLLTAFLKVEARWSSRAKDLPAMKLMRFPLFLKRLIS